MPVSDMLLASLSPLEPLFYAFLSERHEELVETITSSVIEQVAFYRKMNSESARSLFDETVDVLLRTMQTADEMILRSWLEQRLIDRFSAGLTFTDGVLLSSIYRQVFNRQTLAAIERDIVGSRTGLLTINTIFDRFVHILGNVYNERLREMMERTRRFEQVVDNALDAIGIGDNQGQVVYANKAYRDLLGYGDATIGKHIVELLDEDAREIAVEEAFPALEKQGYWRGILLHQHADGTPVPTQLSVVLLDDGGTAVVMRDYRNELAQADERARMQHQMMSAQKELLATQESLLRAQEKSLREMSTPLLMIAPTVMVMPLVGSIDDRRAQQMIEILLEGVSAQAAEVVIIDITGVSVVDTQIADAILRAARALRLIGAQVVLTGIRAEVAQTLVGLGADLRDITTRSTLQSGIAYALNQL